MELRVHESILILTSEVDLVLSLEEMWIYSRNNSRSNMLHLHIETDASQFIDIKWERAIDRKHIVQQKRCGENADILI